MDEQITETEAPEAPVLDDATRAKRLADLQALIDLMRPAVQADGGDLVRSMQLRFPYVMAGLAGGRRRRGPVVPLLACCHLVGTSDSGRDGGGTQRSSAAIRSSVLKGLAR